MNASEGTPHSTPCTICGSGAIPDDLFDGYRHVMNSFDWSHKAQVDPAPAEPAVPTRGDLLACNGQPVVVIRLDSTGEMTEIFPGDHYDGYSSRGRIFWVRTSDLGPRTDATAWRIRRTSFQNRNRPAYVAEARCPDTTGRTDAGMCPTCNRYLRTPGRHRPNQNGAYGWLEFYADRTFYFVPPGGTPRRTR
ncbi:hypothetical protein AB0395_22240 [Streptosporangium sp. NPDC051023]|uniref:hypothetical protein n=1 Tax=Streptosporangium sp. NPDC051023 TaxID=3155410 RepID=UPI00344FEDD4